MSSILTLKNLQKIPKKSCFPWKTARLLILIAGGVALLFIIGVFAYFAKDLPSPGKISSRVVVESTKIYDRTGDKLLYDIHGEEKRTIIVYESPHRLLKTLQDIMVVFHDPLLACVREATKKFEEIKRGRASNLLAHFNQQKPRGELVLVWNPAFGKP